MRDRFIRWFSPPVFPTDPIKTRQAALINFVLLTGLGLDLALIASNLLIQPIHLGLIAVDLVGLGVILGAHYRLERGQLRWLSEGLILAGFIGLTIGNTFVGSVRGPVAAGYLVLIIMSGLVLNWRGIILTCILTSAATVGLLLAELSGWLQPTVHVTAVTEWLALLVWLAAAGSLAAWGLHSTRDLLTRAEQEVTARRAAEAALHEAQQLAHIGSWEWNLQTQTLDWSDEVYRIFGLTPGEFAPSAEAFESFIHPEDRDDFLSRRARMLAETRAAVIDHRIIRRDGRVRWVQERAQVWVDDRGQTFRVTGTVQDISERVQAEEALRNSEEEYRTVVTALNEGIVLQNAAGEVINCNPAVERILGITPAQLMGQVPVDPAWVTTRADGTPLAPEEYPAMVTLATGQAQHNVELRVHKPTGEALWVNVNSVALCKPGETRPHAVVASFMDITTRKQLEVDLRQSEERWSFALEGSGDGVWDWDATTNRVFFSRQWKAMLGYADDEIGNDLTEWSSRVHPDDLPVAQADLQRHFSGQTPVYQNEHRVRAKDGTYHWVLDRGKIVSRTPDGQPNRVIGTHSDITARKQLEEALRQSETTLRTLFDATDEAIALIEPDGRLVAVNAVMAARLGQSAEAMIGHNIYDYLPPAVADRRRQLANQVVTSRQQARATDENHGHWLESIAAPVLDEAGQVRQIAIFARDITERVQAEARFRRFWDLPLIGMALTAPDRRFIQVNERLADMLGYSPAELMGVSWADITHPDDVAENVRLLNLTLAGERDEYSMDKRFFRRDGQVLYANIAARCIRHADGSVDHLALVIQDITDRKLAEESLRIQYDLGQALASIDDLPAALDRILDAALQLESFDSGGIYLADPAGNLDLAVHRGLSPQFIATARHYPADTPQARMALAGQVIYGSYPNLRPETTRENEGEGLRGLAVVPVVHASQVLAVFNLASHTHDVIPAHAARAIETIAQQIASTLMRLRAAAALRESQHNLQTLFDTVEDFLFVLDAAGNMIKVNAFTLNRLGYAAEELLGQNVLMVHPPDRREEASVIIAEMLAGWCDFCPIPLLTHNGDLIPVETRVTAGTWSGQPALFGLSRDMTERYRAEAALRESEAKFRAIIEQSSEGVALIDEEGIIIEWNHAQGVITGVLPDQALGAPAWDVQWRQILPERRAHLTPADLKRTLLDTLATGQSPQFQRAMELTLQTASGEIKTLMQNAFPIQTARGYRMGVIIHDVTERRRMEDALRELNATLEQRVADRTAELQAANEHLKELDRLRDEFMSRVSHELRTPLTSIKIYLELLENAKPEKREKYLKTLTREADRLHVLIEDVLTLTQLSRDTLDMELVEFDVDLVLSARLPRWEEMAQRRGLAFSAQLPAGLPRAQLDKLFTLQVVTQLMNNAISYTPSGSITLSIGLCVEAAQRWITVGVTDTGPGITPEDLPHIFERFYRGRAAADYTTPGTGVGLSIAREIAQKMGGRLTVDTQLGVGSTFTLWLPVAA